VKPFNFGLNLVARCATSRALLAAATVAALVPALPTHAQTPPAADAGASDQMQAARQVHVEYIKLQQRLGEIQKKTMEANPELQKQEKAFMDLMMQKMTSSGTNAKEELAAIEDLEKKLANKDTPEAERQTLLNEYRQKAVAFRTAQMKAMKDPEVAKAQEALTSATMDAMKKQDPQTEQLLKELEQKQVQMQQIMQSAGNGK
jgi:hypothetical protein